MLLLGWEELLASSQWRRLDRLLKMVELAHQEGIGWGSCPNKQYCACLRRHTQNSKGNMPPSYLEVLILVTPSRNTSNHSGTLQITRNTCKSPGTPAITKEHQQVTVNTNNHSRTPPITRNTCWSPGTPTITQEHCRSPGTPAGHQEHLLVTRNTSNHSGTPQITRNTCWSPGHTC